MPVLIQSVEPGSYAARSGIRAGDVLVSIGQNQIQDVLDYRFYVTSRKVALHLLRAGAPFSVSLKKEEYEDIGLEFETYLMDRQRSCKNKCMFCFVDQMPKGMRESLYFKDDDSRMSFLFGNYITMTNLTDADIDRIIKMKISPVNVSVHTTDPDLRVRMMKNPAAATSLRFLERLCGAGIQVNSQLVLCPGINDGSALERTLHDLGAFYPSLQSIACVPVGLTRYRDRLPELHPYDRKRAVETIEIIHRFAENMLKQYGARVAYPSDEFFLKAEQPIPPTDYYAGFEQLEDGVGVLSLLESEFLEAMEQDEKKGACGEVTVVTGTAAYPLIQSLAKRAMEKNSGLSVEVYPIVNRFFGETINVAGLVTGQDIAAQMKGRKIGGRVLLPAVMLRHERDRFLDDMTVEQLEDALGAPVKPVDNDGWQLYDAITGR